MKWLLLIALVVLSGCAQQCGMENCHGLDITCGPNVPDACTEIYMLGDRCRQYASCEVIDGECQLVESSAFETCKSCVENCSEEFGQDHTMLFECESGCISTITTVITETVGGCGKFEYSIAELDKVDYILPMGGTSGDHVAPIDHIYLWSDQDVEMYSPGKGTVIDMQHMGSFRGDDENLEPFDDYRLVIIHDCYESTFIHLDELAPKLAAVAPEFGEYKSVNVPVEAGELLGTYTGSMDYLVVDESKTNNLINPESYKDFSQRLHIFDPFDYFVDEIRSQLQDKCLRTAEPVGGFIDYDKDGTLLGTWFKDGTNGWSGLNPERYWRHHLAIIYNNIDPDHIVVSIGNYSGRSAQYCVKGNEPDPALVTTETGMIKYYLVGYDYTDGENVTHMPNKKGLEMINYEYVNAVLLLQLLEDRVLKYELFPDTEEAAAFTENAEIYVR